MPPSAASMEREEAVNDEEDSGEINLEDMQAVDRWRRQRSGEMHYLDTRSSSSSKYKVEQEDEESDIVRSIPSYMNINNDITIIGNNMQSDLSNLQDSQALNIEVMRNDSFSEMQQHPHTMIPVEMQNSQESSKPNIHAVNVLYTLEKPQNKSQDSVSMNDVYLSSSSETEEDPIIFSQRVSGPIDLDDVDDGALTRIQRPGTDDGESQPSQNGSWKKSHLTRSISVESQELDAMVAAIDAVQHHKPSPGSSVKQPPHRSSDHQEHMASVRKQLAMPTKRLLSPNRRDSPPVRFEELDGSFPPLVSPDINNITNHTVPRGRGTSVSTPSERRRQRSLSRGRSSRSASPAVEQKQQQQHVPSTPSTATATPPWASHNGHNKYASTPSWDDSEDRLSDVPSDVETDVRERYLTACRILKSTLIEKASKLKPSEKEFLIGLLERNGNSIEPSEEHLSAMESLAETLQIGDSLFQEENQSMDREEMDVVHVPGSSVEDNNVREEAKQNNFLTKLLTKDQVVEPSPTSTTMSAVSSSIYVYDYPFKILGTDDGFQPSVLTPAVMEALRGFFPPDISQENFLLKFSSQRDGADFGRLLTKIRFCKYTILSVETTSGHVFGSFCSSPWRVQKDWYGEKDSFLWRLKRPREKGGYFDISSFDLDNDNEMEVFPCTGNDNTIQYCTNKTIAVGGSTYWTGEGGNPYSGEPEGIGLLIDGDLLGGETNSCATFANPRLGDRSSSLNEFDIDTLEVWTVTPSATTAEAEKLEIQRLYIERSIKNQ